MLQDPGGGVALHPMQVNPQVLASVLSVKLLYPGVHLTHLDFKNLSQKRHLLVLIKNEQPKEQGYLLLGHTMG